MAKDRKPFAVGAAIAALSVDMFDAYRPERHYMRGPGPKWHAKHDPAPVAVEAASLPPMIRAKAR